MTTTTMAEQERNITSFHLSILVLYALITCTTAADTIAADQTIKGNETILSPQQTFELGFFSPENSTNRYVGIWYKKISPGTVMWVANRNSPLSNNSGELSLTLQGILVLRNSTGDVIWSSANSSSSLPSVRNPVAQLLDTGNFIIREENGSPENPIWQSFDFPSDTFVPGMKFGKDLVTGLERYFTSWKSENDPSIGDHSVWIETKGYPQLIVRDGRKIRFRAGPWNGLRFSGEPNLRPNSIYRFGFVLDQREMYYHFDLINSSVVTRVVLKPSGSLERLLWIENRREWLLYLTPQTDSCDRYGLCGPFGSCDINNSLSCECLEGFEPASPDQWNVADWTQGCRRSTPLDCGSGDGFRKYSNLKLPDTQESWFNQSMNLDECKMVCEKNCNCSAYTTQNITGSGSGCLLWFGNLIDIRTFMENGQYLYIRMPASELATGRSSSVKRRVVIIVPIISVLLIILLSVCVFYRIKKRKAKQEGTLKGAYGDDPGDENSKDDLELPLIDFSILRKATNNFSDNNKLGEGGFGPVYKGVLGNGQEVAVKRLSKTSTQGLDEFKNEVICISKLQHRNLVKLLGCCIKGAEKMLVYEYMPNKGLDSFIFDGTQSKILDWPTRFHIIKGIARGLVYLHQDSRLRIIHRDLKVSNILLDHDMIPKISDFGLARSFGGNQIEANTNRVVGTYGYMAPEYAGDGIFSIKSDVFSFGVLVLEIVSGKKNRGFLHKEHSNNLLGHAWGLHKEGRSLELVAASLDESISLSEAIRLIHVSLLCVQQRPEDRPTMSSVILMLESDGKLPPPKLPGFFYEKATTDTGYSSSTYGANSTNELTVTMLNAR
ncbi:G-type lectin S-receptor-like serine/threonine-protein kinase At4g27290 isoform X1 [Cynara cardunculus var. scolymus]|uniref:G-type lectin S-receptor-like serine/threonine-protein kinase At4g27290 isoform X1 n=1 Tax=Cynara cardunculus var. scolymus TaxID=59895 RepID=UPI000D62A0F6|nr:G-type lectin S-receptor-like serine/threonine-protein kinase At4g27290 isoform X1 [Cynara cardunculus var. scolymus]